MLSYFSAHFRLDFFFLVVKKTSHPVLADEKKVVKGLPKRRKDVETSRRSFALFRVEKRFRPRKKGGAVFGKNEYLREVYQARESWAFIFVGCMRWGESKACQTMRLEK